MIDKLLSDFIDAWTAGERPRVSDYLDRAEPDERDELAERLEDWLLLAPTPRYTEQTLAEIRAEPALAGALAEIDGLPHALPRLRERAGLRLSDLARRITSTFGLAGQEERTEAYLERMERGELDAAGVSRRLLDAMAGALGVSADALGRSGGMPSPAMGSALFRAESAAAAGYEEDLEALSQAALSPAPPPMDELDRLFLGGPEA
jgi:transcriptional regulator with XRE-family HTH domain